MCTVLVAWTDLVANLVEPAWLTRYPLPNKIIVDRGNKLIAKFRNMINNDYGIRVKPIISRNPQANSILEQVHQTISNILHTFKLQDIKMDDDNPCYCILISTMLTLKDTVHKKTQYAPGQLVFGCDSILN